MLARTPITGAERRNERVEMVAEDVSTGSPARSSRPGRIRVLLIEDDDGDALLVDELLLDAGAPFSMSRARSIAEARAVLTDEVCVLLDLELPDSRGLQGVRMLQEFRPDLAVVVLTGIADEHLGEQAVATGAQDYLVKGQVDGYLLQRVVRYAIERRRAEETQRQLSEARLYAAENARLERGLLPSPPSGFRWSPGTGLAASRCCSGAIFTMWSRQQTAGCTRWWATSAAAARMRRRSAYVSGWPGGQ
jgi:FixJ family two-component response regulator